MRGHLLFKNNMKVQQNVFISILPLNIIVNARLQGDEIIFKLSKNKNLPIAGPTWTNNHSRLHSYPWPTILSNKHVCGLWEEAGITLYVFRKF